MVLLLNLLCKLGINKVTIAGFDGYDEKIENCYYKEYVPLLYDMSTVPYRNTEIKKFLKDISSKIQVTSLTETQYLD